jgi:very-short-patch-repair endonuclease
MGTGVRTVERVVARIAQRQHGLVTRDQLINAGVSARQIRVRVARGSLFREHRGVYRVGHRAPTTEATYLAAVLAAGEGAGLSGLAAGYLNGLVKGRPPPPEVTARTERRIEGVKTHRCRFLNARSCTVVSGIPVTSVARTLVDIAARLSDEALARACHEAGVQYRTTPADVAAELALRPNIPGARRLRRVIEGDVHVTLSALERRFLQHLDVDGLRLPITNRPAGGRRVDCRWPDQRLTVELDSYRFHNSRRSWEQDRRREREARARGDEFRRYTHEDVFEDPRFMLRELRLLLSRFDDPG